MLLEMIKELVNNSFKLIHQREHQEDHASQLLLQETGEDQ